MFKSSTFEIGRLKKILILILILIIILGLSITGITTAIKAYPNTVQKAITDKFNNISYNLEFGGINKKVKQITSDYSALFDGYSNIIITNDNSDILFNLNNGYMSEKKKFSVIVNPSNDNEYESDIAYLIDSKNKIKYAAQLGLCSNMNNIKTQSSKNSLTKGLFMNEESDENSEDEQITNTNQVTYESSADTDIIMNYNYIASKGLNLYCLYNSEHQYNNYFKFTSLLKIIRQWLAGIIIAFSVVFFILVDLLIFKIRRLKRLNLEEVLKQNDIICPHCGEKISINKQGK
jgi:hypothetical protein